MDAFRLLAEQRIRDAIARGELDELEGKGRPVNLEGYANLPPELRAALKLLQDAGIRPKEVDLVREAAQLKGAIAQEPSAARRAELQRELSRVQTELEVLLGKTVPCGCSRPRKRRRWP